jgi:predicted nucleic acid-binding protein
VGHRQVADATLLHIAKAHGLKLVTFDRPAASIALSDEDVEVLFS